MEYSALNVNYIVDVLNNIYVSWCGHNYIHMKPESMVDKWHQNLRHSSIIGSFLSTLIKW